MHELTILEMQAMMEQGATNASQFVLGYLERIDALDRKGPRLNSIIELNPDVIDEATRLDAERKKGHVRGLLHGIPIVLKDNIDTADRMTTTAGSLALEGSIAKQDAFLVSQLRRAGAIILGKANLSEWANFRSKHSVSGWSSRGGQTRNPYVLDRSPCGSSSGSAVAVAANLCAAAVGTETDGSITCPAHINGLVGIKPTLGLVSRSGIIPIAHSQDTAGPLARSVSDAAILLATMAGSDPLDPATASNPEQPNEDYLIYLKQPDLRGVRLGVLRKLFGFNPCVDRVMTDCLDALMILGAELVDPVEIETMDKLGETEIQVLNYEFKADLNAYLSKLNPQAKVHSLEEVIAFNEQNKDRVMPFFGQERMLEAQEKGALTEEVYLKALEANHRLARTEGIDATLQKHNLQAIIGPTGSPAWLVDFVNGDCIKDGDSTSPAAVAGYPHITVPAGQVHGLPVGISFMGKAYSEPLLLRIAYAFEQATKARRPPKFKRHIKLGI